MKKKSVGIQHKIRVSAKQREQIERSRALYNKQLKDYVRLQVQRPLFFINRQSVGKTIKD